MCKTSSVEKGNVGGCCQTDNTDIVTRKQSKTDDDVWLASVFVLLNFCLFVCVFSIVEGTGRFVYLSLVYRSVRSVAADLGQPSRSNTDT